MSRAGAGRGIGATYPSGFSKRSVEELQWKHLFSSPKRMLQKEPSQPFASALCPFGCKLILFLFFFFNLY